MPSASVTRAASKARSFARHTWPSFDYWLYTQNNASPSHVNPVSFIRNGQRVGRLEGASAEIGVNEAIQFLGSNQGQPLFLNLWFHETHEPMAPKQESLALYPGKMHLDRQHAYGIWACSDGCILQALA